MTPKGVISNADTSERLWDILDELAQRATRELYQTLTNMRRRGVKLAIVRGVAVLRPSADHQITAEDIEVLLKYTPLYHAMMRQLAAEAPGESGAGAVAGAGPCEPDHNQLYLIEWRNKT